MITEQEEFINKSEWLSPEEIKRYGDFAVKNGRKIYNNGVYLPSLTDKLPIERLADDENVIERHHCDIGLAFKILCDCAEGRGVGAKNPETPEGSQIEPNLKLVAIMNQMRDRQLFIVNHILFDCEQRFPIFILNVLITICINKRFCFI